MGLTPWFIVSGVLFVVMALSNTVLERLPVTTSLLYLLVGVALGPLGVGLLHIDPMKDAELLERITEIALIISLFTAGLKLRAPLRDPQWYFPLRLATVSVIVTAGLIALAGVYGLGLPVGAAILLGGILAPTDPVLASGIQVEDAFDRDHLRFSLTGEAALNDGTTAPFMLLGLGLLSLHELGAGGWRWVIFDLAWAIAAAIAVGGGLGTLIGRLVIHLRREHK